MSYQKAVARLCSVDCYYNLLSVMTNCWDCSIAVFRFVLSQALCKSLCRTHFESEGRCRLRRSEDSLLFRCMYLSQTSAAQFPPAMDFYVVPIFPFFSLIWFFDFQRCGVDC